ncbi:Uncharacterized AAA domain-containing protein C16E9.10c [Durusdinium trenchii]|uniref:Uncharacterized AAA domain-containing protein C16E9.10c n=1 Tax=Durusdinium trenchii TaxID=1381693 RepID=A0ABP0QBS6_9DINO
MDKRLPHRIREIRLQFQSAGKTCTADSVKDELCRTFTEYSRLKQPALRRMVLQELSTPLPEAPESTGPEIEPKKKRRKGEKKPELASPAEKENMNDSIRRLYSQSTANDASLGAKAERLGQDPQSVRKAREKASMAAARREQGWSDPKAQSSFQPEDRPEERLEDLGGVDDILQDLRQLVVQPLSHPEVFSHLGVQPPTGVLLFGPPGCGKTKIAHAIAGTTGVPFFKIAATEIVSGMSGESEAKIRQLFQAATSAAPSLIFMDEVDAITPKRDSAGREMERRIVAQLLTSLDEIQKSNVIVLAATNRPDALDPALRRAGRFDREIAMGIPDEAARAKILEKMVQGMRLAESLDLKFLAKKTAGFVGADLSALTKEAALGAVERAFKGLAALARDSEGSDKAYTAEEMSTLAIEAQDFTEALSKVQPSARREGFTTIPDVKWEDVGALQEVQMDMDAAVCEPIRKAELFRELGLTVPVGVLLFGPPGCGKTLLAKATANQSGANFIAVKGPELLNKYVGESERAVRLVFQRARSSAPCVIFFDELDALVPRRSSEGNGSSERVVNQMLTEMDGVQSRSQVFVIAATNRPDIVDPAMLRPGRLDRLLYVPFGDPEDAHAQVFLKTRIQQFTIISPMRVTSEIVAKDLSRFAEEAEGFSGADLASLAREAAMQAIRRAAASPTRETSDAQEHKSLAAAAGVQVTTDLLAQARSRIQPSVGKQERKEYEELAYRLCGWRPEKERPDQPNEAPTHT